MSLELLVDSHNLIISLPIQYQVFDDITSCLLTIYFNGKANVAIVDSVETKIGYRNQGFATKLMERILRIAEFHNVDSVELVVNHDNEAAIRLYEKVGFEPTQKIYYRKILNKWPESKEKAKSQSPMADTPTEA